jgi:hypothetical protein
MNHRIVLSQVTEPDGEPSASPSVCILDESLGVITLQVCLDKDQDMPEAGCQISIEAADLLDAVGLLRKSAVREEKRLELEAPLRERGRLQKEVAHLRLNLARTQRRKDELVSELETARHRIAGWEELERRVDAELIEEIRDMADGHVEVQEHPPAVRSEAEGIELRRSRRHSAEATLDAEESPQVADEPPAETAISRADGLARESSGELSLPQEGSDEQHQAKEAGDETSTGAAPGTGPEEPSAAQDTAESSAHGASGPSTASELQHEDRPALNGAAEEARAPVQALLTSR